MNSLDKAKRYIDFSKDRCPICFCVLPREKFTGKTRFRNVWWEKQYEQRCENCEFERGRWKLLNPLTLLY